jgi:hypothetical protein
LNSEANTSCIASIRRGSPADIEEGFLLAGERCLRQVFGGCGGAHRDGHVRSVTLAHFGPCRLDGCQQCRWQRCGEYPVADGLPAAGQLLDVVDIQIAEQLVYARVESVLRKEFTIGMRGRGETAGHANIQCRELADHFAQRGILATDAMDVGESQQLQGDYVGFHLPPMSRPSIIGSPQPAMSVRHEPEKHQSTRRIFSVGPDRGDRRNTGSQPVDAV